MLRFCLSSLLCLALSMGQLPLWLHLSDCDGICGEKVAAQEFTCEYGCSHHESVPPDPLKGQERDHGHDSGQCSICQSLVLSAAVDWELDLTSAFSENSEPHVCESDQADLEREFSSHLSRGPPACI